MINDHFNSLLVSVHFLRLVHLTKWLRHDVNQHVHEHNHYQKLSGEQTKPCGERVVSFLESVKGEFTQGKLKHKNACFSESRLLVRVLSVELGIDIFKFFPFIS